MTITTFSLENELKTFSAECERSALAEARAATERFVSELAASRKGQPSLMAGETAPRFELADPDYRNRPEPATVEKILRGISELGGD